MERRASSPVHHEPGQEANSRVSLLFFFLHLAPLRLNLLNNLVLQLLWNRIVMVHLH